MSKEGFGPHGNEFKYEDPEFRVTDEVRRAFDDKGFIIIRGLMDSVEIGKIKKSLEEYGLVEKYSYGLPDTDGREPRMMLWSYCGDDVLGLVPRSEKVVSTAEQLLGGDELYHYHTKIMMKDPKKGGSFEWHQDYGYWYKNGNLKPDLLSLFLAVDPCVKENGGLQVMVGSHRGGRIDHNFDGGQQGADKERVEHLKKVYEHFYINLQPGDGLLFHCNLLHSSGPNDSEQRRWAFNCSYNKRSNNPVKKHHHPFYNKLSKVLVESHRGGRIDHEFDGGQQGADKERVEHLKKVYEHFYINLQPGDGLLFHCNLLHSSGPNDSAQRRWAFNCSYNKRSNNPVKKHHHPFYNKLSKVPNNALRECENYCQQEGKDFADPASDETVRAGSKPGES